MGSGGLLSAIFEPLFGSAPEAPEAPSLPTLPKLPEDPQEMTAEERQAEEARRSAARQAAKNPTILTAGMKLGQPETEKKTLLGG